VIVSFHFISSTQPTYNEENSQDNKTTKLDRLSSKSINSRNRNPVAWNSTCEDNDDISNGGVVEVLIDIVCILCRVSNDFEDSSVVQRETVESNIETEPRTSGSKEQRGILPLAVVLEEVSPASLGNFKVGLGALKVLGPRDFIGVSLTLSVHISLDVLICLLNVTGNIEGVTGSFRDGKTVY
jgi:hypothetical protein